MSSKIKFAAGFLLFVSPAFAGLTPIPTTHARVTVAPLVADQKGKAPNTDPNLVNAWGISLDDEGELWVSDNGTDLVTAYDSNTGVPTGTAINIPMGAPTGNVYVPDGVDFQISENGKSGRAELLFDTESGAIEGWNEDVDENNAVVAVDNSANGAVYKGLTVDAGTQQLYAANFTKNQVEVYDTSFHLVNTFTDSALPKGYAPFNVADINGLLYVAFAERAKACCDEIGRPHLGYVDVFDTSGQLVQRLISKGKLSAPWGMTIAPAGFGTLAGDLLVGNFGDGRINAFDPASGKFLGTLRSQNGAILKIDGLWGLIAGPSDGQLTFAAGPADESHGLVGLLSPATGSAAR